MPYIIDGHNLIPKLGLRLDSIDDELDLLARLQEFCRLRRTQVEVYFDGAPPGQASTRKAGVVTAHFVRQGSSADASIETPANQAEESGQELDGGQFRWARPTRCRSCPCRDNVCGRIRPGDGQSTDEANDEVRG